MFDSFCAGFNPRVKWHGQSVSKHFSYQLLFQQCSNTSLPQPLMTATGPTNRVLITILALGRGFVSHPAPIWCAEFSSYRKLLALLKFASSCHFINTHAHMHTGMHTPTPTHTHITGITCSESEIFYWTFLASANIPLRIAYNYSYTLILQSHKLLIS
jgi:hypothetical protein